MKMIKNLCVVTAIFAAPSLYAQTENQSQSYGDNPNIFRVLAKKTSDAVQNTAEKVGNATERGIQKIKPALDSTIENTKSYTTEQATIARDNTRQGIDTAVKKVEQTKEKIMGRTSSNVPIEQGSLSQSSSNSNNQTNYNTTYTAPIGNSVPINSQPVQQIPLNQSTQNQVQNNVQAEPEIKKQSLPIESSPVEKSADNSATQNNSTQSSTSQSNTTITSAKDSSDDDAGVPK